MCSLLISEHRMNLPVDLGRGNTAGSDIILFIT